MLKSGVDVIVLTGRTDLRKGVDGLAALIRLNYELVSGKLKDAVEYSINQKERHSSLSKIKRIPFY